VDEVYCILNCVQYDCTNSSFLNSLFLANSLRPLYVDVFGVLQEDEPNYDVCFCLLYCSMDLLLS
jgi:hypothetical protein